MRKTINDFLDEYTGYTYKSKIVTQASKALLEAKIKALGYHPQISEVALVTITDPATKEILGMGGSIPNDLVLDQFGTWLAGLIKPVASTIKSVTLKGDDGVLETVYVHITAGGATSVFNRKDPAGAVNVGTQIKVGSGSTSPVRTNFQIETVFPTAPESGYFSTNDGSYSAGGINLSGSISAGGSGTIRESILASVWVNSANLTKVFAWFRDGISPNKAFVAAQLINVAYTINL